MSTMTWAVIIGAAVSSLIIILGSIWFVRHLLVVKDRENMALLRDGNSDLSARLDKIDERLANLETIVTHEDKDADFDRALRETTAPKASV